MIAYKSNRNWFQDIKNFSKSQTMRLILKGVGIMGVYTAIVCVIMENIHYDTMASSGIFSLLGIVLSISLVFRTNSAYDRWWEGRILWGQLVNNCRNMAVVIHSILPKNDQENRYYFAKNLANFCYAFKNHLRSKTDIDGLLMLTDDEKRELLLKDHKPNHISYWLYQRITDLYNKGVIGDAQMINIRDYHKSLLDVLGGCERILKTPIPFSYAVYIKLFISAYGFLMPFAMVHDFHYYTIPLVMFIFFAMFGLEMMAEEIEEPFGTDNNDLPTDEISNNIRINVFEILEQKENLIVNKLADSLKQA